MKYLFPIFLFFLLLTHSLAQPHGGPQEEEQVIEETDSGYTPIDNSQVTSDPQLQGLLFIGVQSGTKQAIEDGYLPEGNYQVSKVNSAAQKGDNYRFEVEIADEQGNAAHILFYMTYDSSAGTTHVYYFDIVDHEGGETTGGLGELGEGEFGETAEAEEIFEETLPIFEEEEEILEQTEDGFVILDPSVAQTDTEIAGILNVGVQEATKQAIQNGSLFSSSYDLAKVYSVQQNMSNPDEYRFDVSVRNSIPSVVRMNFDLIYDESNNTVEILSWGFADIIEEEESSIESEIPEGYQEVKFDINDPNQFVNQLKYMGLQVVMTTGVLEGTIPSYSYQATNVHSVSQKLEGDKLYYRFDLDGADAYGNTARFIYVISYDPATSASKLEEMQITEVVWASN